MSFDMRPQTAGERRADAVLHALGAGAAFAGIISIARSLPLDAAHVVAAILYCGGACAMFGCSALYNLTMHPVRKRLFQRFDHAAIFLMIAGTYTPLAMLSLRDPTGAVLLVLVWLLALIGALLKLISPAKFERLAIVAYLVLGWTALAFTPALIRAVSPLDLGLIAVGGVIYTSGVGFHLSRRLKFQNAIWHGFVLLGAGFQFAAVRDVVTS